MKEELLLKPGAEGFANLWRAPADPFGSHHHQELEVNLVVAGRAAYLFGRERVPIVVGSLIWLFPEQEHLIIDCSRDFAMWVLVFTPELVMRHSKSKERRILRCADPGEILCRQISPPTADTLEHAYQSVTVGTEDLEFSNTALGYALLTSWRAFQLSQDLIAWTNVHPAIAKAVRLISTTDEPIPLPELARQSGLSASRLSRLFKAQTGVGLTEFRQRKCVERFIKIYRDGARYSLIEAALLAGFGSYPQFHRVFLRFVGRSPGAYATKVGRRAK